MPAARVVGACRWAAGLIAVTAVVSACATPAASENATPGARQTGSPPPAPTVAPDEEAGLPSIPPVPIPSGLPPTPPPPDETGTLYAGDPYDAAGYIAAFRAGYPDVEYQFDDAEVLDIGRNLCTYLMRHADGDKVVALGDAITEADVHLPGYPRSDWVFALDLSSIEGT